MKRCAVVIGVNKTGDLPVLNAAASGARDFAKWARDQGFSVKLLTDENGKTVSIGDVKKAIQTFVEEQTFDQLIVFFSGHGLLRGPEYELWLLSGAPDDPDDAVNVSGSIWLARSSGLSHVVVISDACRSRPGTVRLSQVTGGSIFPNLFRKAPRPAVDVFYATLPGDPALEVPATEATANYRGIFTECLLEGLSGKVPNLIVNIGWPPEVHWVVPSWELKPYLEEKVPEVASDIDIKLQQDPEIRVESHPPKFLAEISPPSPPVVTPPTSVPPSVPPKSYMTFRQIVRSLKDDKFFQRHVSDGSLPPNAREVAEQSDFAQAMGRIVGAKGRESFETRTGFTLVGADIARAIVTRTRCDVFQESGAFQIRVHENGGSKNAQSLFVQLTGQVAVPLAVLPGFIGTIVVEDGRIVNVNYTPSRGTLKYDEYRQVADEIEQRRAFVAVAARNGLFRLDGGLEAMEGARFLRALKSLDPTLGLYAAYAYAQAGQFDGVESVFRYMRDEPEPVPFDVALLAHQLPGSTLPGGNERVAPFCPMLTQGWAILESSQGLLGEAVRIAGQHLIPGLWTTFAPKGVDILWSAIEQGMVV